MVRMNFVPPNLGLKIRLPLFRKRSGSDRGSRDSAQPCRVAIGRILIPSVVDKSVCPIGARPCRVPAPVGQFLN
jgi:hypothetical protein